MVSAPIPQPLPDALVELVAQRFRVIGEPMRIRLLERLREGGRSVNDLADALGSSQQNVSKHLGVLHQAGIVTRHKQGNHVVYAIADESVFALCETVCDGIQQQVADLARRAEVV
jgi:DNA-binding transcriptional ArsR family regulator